MTATATVPANVRSRRQSGITLVRTWRLKADVGSRFSNAIECGRVEATALSQTFRLVIESNGLDVPPAATFSTCV